MNTQTETGMGINQSRLEEPRISALIPSYNRAHLLPRAIDSILNQTYAPAEIIVVDDGSVDNTREAMAAYEGRVRYVFQENAGSAVARHNGITIAQSEWVAFLDSDDVWNSDHLEHISSAIIATGGRANYYFSDTRRTRENDHQMHWQMTGFSIDAPYVLVDKGSEWVLKGRQPMMLQASVINRAAYIASGGFLPSLRSREDTHLFIKLGLKSPICAVAGGGAQMTDDDQPENRLSITHNRARKGINAQVVMFEDLLDYFGDQLTPEEEETLTMYLAEAYLGMARHSWRERDISGMARYMMLAGVKRPRTLVDMLGRKVRLSGPADELIENR